MAAVNNFTHEELVMFDKMVEGFDDLLVIGKAATKFTPEPGEVMNHLGDKVWIPQPMIAASYDGFDQTANFGGFSELAIPVTIGYHKSSNGSITAKALRSQRTLNNYADAAKQKLTSDINAALFNTVALQGSVVVKRTVAPSGFDDVAAADAAFTEIGVGLANRMMFLSPRTYNGMASNLAQRNEMTARSSDAYSKALINSDIAGFEVYKNDQTRNLTAAAGGATTVNGANQFYTPISFSVAATGETSNVDNRYSQLVVTAATYGAINPGDAFTIAGVNSVHMVTKLDTGQLQTFRVIGKPSAGVLLIAPALISGGGGTKAELEYKNVTATPANGAAITWLNTVTAGMSPFFKKESLLIIPGAYSIDNQAGWQVMTATTDMGIALSYVRQGNINDLSMKFRWDIDFGTCLTNPQLAGVELFNQT